MFRVENAATHSPSNPHTTRDRRPENARTTKKATPRLSIFGVNVLAVRHAGGENGEGARESAARDRLFDFGASAAAREWTGRRGFVRDGRLLRFRRAEGTSRGW